MPDEKKLIKLTCVLLCTALAVFLVFFAVKYFAAAFLPFIVAWSIALGLRRPASFLQKHAKLPRKAAAMATVIIFAFVCGYIFFLLGSVLIKEGRELYGRLSADTAALERTVSDISELLSAALQKLPYFGKSPAVVSLARNFDERVLAWASDSVPQILSFIGTLLARIARSVPFIALFLLVTVIAVFYFSADLDRINRNFALMFPEKQRKTLYLIKEELFSVVFGYIRAYSLIIALTFTELFIGLSIIGTEYAFLVSFLIAVVDILPVLGAGTVLVPWGVFRLAFGDFRDGICILVLYLIITVVRQMAEPRIVGSFLGLHPLCTLAAIYVGARLAGVAGIFIFPVAAIVARNVWRRTHDGVTQTSSHS